MKTDGILTFTAKYREAMSSEARQILEKHLHAGEDLIFLDFVTIKERVFRRPAFLAMTSQRFLIFRPDPFELHEYLSVSWFGIESVQILPNMRLGFFRPDAVAELKYQVKGKPGTVRFSVGHPGTPDKTETLVNNLNLRYSIGDKRVVVVGDTVVIADDQDQHHLRLRRWVFDLKPNYQRESLLVLLTNEDVIHQRLHNLLCLDINGEVQWRADLPTSKAVPDSFLKISVKDGYLEGQTWSGLSCHLSPENGCIVELERIAGGNRSKVDQDIISDSGLNRATLLFAGEDRLENKLYRLFIDSGHFFKERLFGGAACWSPDGRFLAVQEVYLSRSQGIQSVGVVLFDLAEEKEALVEKSISRNFIPQGWKDAASLLYGKGPLQERGESFKINVDEVFWLPMKNGGCAERARKY